MESKVDILFCPKCKKGGIHPPKGIDDIINMSCKWCECEFRYMYSIEKIEVYKKWVKPVIKTMEI